VGCPFSNLLGLRSNFVNGSANKIEFENYTVYQSDPLVFWLLKSMGLKPFQIAGITFLTGFGVMSIFYWVMYFSEDPATRLRGLYDFHAVTLGDALTLPILVAIIMASYNNFGDFFLQADLQIKILVKQKYLQRKWALLSFLLSAICVFIFLIRGVYGSERDWTLPRYGYLNAAGWYHGLFMFILLYVVFGYYIRQFLTLAILRQHSHKISNIKKTWERNLEYWIAFMVLIGFFSGLLVSDNIAANSTWSSYLSIFTRDATVLSVYFLNLPLYFFALAIHSQKEPNFNWNLKILIPFLVAFVPIITAFILPMIGKFSQ
jgi:hypothetical protein